MKLTPKLKELIKFGLVGTFNTLLDFAILNLLHKYARFDVHLSATSSYIIASLSAYSINRYWTFKYENKGNHAKKYIQYLIINLIGLILTNLIIFIFTDKLALNYNISKLIAVFLVFPWNYIGNKYWTFKPSIKPNK